MEERELSALTTQGSTVLKEAGDLPVAMLLSSLVQVIGGARQHKASPIEYLNPWDSSCLPGELQITECDVSHNPIHFCLGNINHKNEFNLLSFSLAPHSFPPSNVVSHPIWLWQDSFEDQTSLKLGIG